MYTDLRLLTVAIVLPVIHLLSSAYGETLIRSAGFSKSTVSGHTLQNRVLRRLERVKSPTRCLANCLRDPDCVSVNYSQENGICELNSGEKEEFPEDAENAEYRYYKIDSRSAAQTIQIRQTTTPLPTEATSEAPITESSSTKAPTTEVQTTEYVATQHSPLCASNESPQTATFTTDGGTQKRYPASGSFTPSLQRLECTVNASGITWLDLENISGTYNRIALRPEQMTIARDEVDVLSEGPGIDFGSSPSWWIRYMNGETTVGKDGSLDPIMSAPGPEQGITYIRMGSWSYAEWLITACIPA